MFCPNCGAELPEGSRFCPNCGAPVDISESSQTSESSSWNYGRAANENTNKEANSDTEANSNANAEANSNTNAETNSNAYTYGNANENSNAYTYANAGSNPSGASYPEGPMHGEPITTKRGMVKYIIFSIITFGIYSLYFLYAMARDLNTICEGDGQKTPGMIKVVLLSMITCGIYYLYWYYKFAERVQDNGFRYGVNIKEGGSTVLLWLILGSFLCGIGSLVSLHIFIRNFNTLAEAYNRRLAR